MRSWAVGLLLAAGCGRLDFDAQAPDAMSGDGGTSSFTYPRDRLGAVIGVTQVDLAPAINGTGLAFSIAPALPAGLSLESVTGRISGVAQASAEQTFTITAGGQSALLELIVLPGFVATSDLAGAMTQANNAAGRDLVLLGPGTYTLAAAVPVTDDVIVLGESPATTIIRAGTVHGAYHAFALNADKTLALRDLTVADFGGDLGGAIQQGAGMLDVDRCTFDNNWSPTSGGVLFVNGGATSRLKRCTFTNNRSLGGNGGGWGGVVDGEGTGTAIEVRQSYATGNKTAWGSFSHITSGTTLLLENSTLWNNEATTAGTLATPGGIYTVINSTIVNNKNSATTSDSAGLYLYSAPCHYTVTNSIISNNRDANGTERDCNIRDLSTSLTSNGGNVFGDAGGNCAQYFTQPGDMFLTDPQLETATPAMNGGPTLTLAPKPGSPAVANGSSNCPSTDQRGVARTTPCDSGALER